MVAPGTKLRKALDDIAMANFGALIFFVDETEPYRQMTQGGFKMDTSFAPEKLYELSKMDGAIIVTEDVTKILAANVHLVPDASLPSVETGTRHITSERTARQTGRLVIAVSSRKNTITLYYKTYRYVINNINFLITCVNQALNTLGKYRQNFDKMIWRNDIKEFEKRNNLRDVLEIINKGIEILKIQDEIDPYVIELGSEGKLPRMELKEIAGDVEEFLCILLRDYAKNLLTEEDTHEIIANLKTMKDSGLVAFARVLGFEISSLVQLEETAIKARGYRILRYVARIPMTVLHNVVKTFGNISEITVADLEALQSVEGIGEKRAQAILDSVNSFKKRISSGITFID